MIAAAHPSIIRPKAVAWDIDGTLVDSEPLHHRALLSSGARFHADLSDLPDQAFRGVHMDDVWTILRPRFPAGLGKSEWLAHIGAFYVAHAPDLPPIPGAVETIRALAALEIPQGCVSNSERVVVDANLAALGVAEVMAFTISLDDVHRGKPAPEPYARAVSAFGLTPAEVIAVEDSGTGLASAVAAGLIAVGFQRPGTPPLEAPLTITDPGQVLPLFGEVPPPAGARAP